jgi:hypothetical protein
VYPLCPLARCACPPRSLALLERPLFTRGDPFANKSVQSGQAVALVTNWQQLDDTLTTRARGFQENVSFDHYFGTYPHAANGDGQPFKAAKSTPAVDGLTPGHRPSLPPSRAVAASARACR